MGNYYKRQKQKKKCGIKFSIKDTERTLSSKMNVVSINIKKELFLHHHHREVKIRRFGRCMENWNLIITVDCSIHRSKFQLLGPRSWQWLKIESSLLHKKDLTAPHPAPDYIKRATQLHTQTTWANITLIQGILC